MAVEVLNYFNNISPYSQYKVVVQFSDVTHSHVQVSHKVHVGRKHQSH